MLRVSNSLPFLCLAIFTSTPAFGQAPTLSWARQFGTPGTNDFVYALSASSSAIYVVGSAGGSLAETNAGLWDAFVRKYDLAGNVVWTRQFGTSGYDFARAVAADETAVYVAGYSEIYSPYSRTGFLRKYDPAGTLVWALVLNSTPGVHAKALTLDPTGVYLAGETSSSPMMGPFYAYVSKYDSDGHLLWHRPFTDQFATASEGLAHDETGIYVTGSTQGGLQGTNAGYSDIFVRKYDGAGTVLWTRQLGTPDNEFATGIAASAGSVYVSGGLNSMYVNSPRRAVAYRLDALSNVWWTRQMSLSDRDDAYAVAADPYGAYFGGSTLGGLSDPFFGYQKGFVRRYDIFGNPGWTLQLSPADAYVISSVLLHGGAIYAGGGVSSGTSEAVVMKYSLPYDQLLAKLINSMNAMGLPAGLQNSLEAKLRQFPACNHIRTFLHEVEVHIGKGLTDIQAAELMAGASEIAVSLTCPLN